MTSNFLASSAARPRFQSQRTRDFTESVIREMTRLALHHGAINLAQGFPDFPAPASIKKAAHEAIDADLNQYAITWGAKPLRDAIAAKYRRTYGLDIDAAALPDMRDRAVLVNSMSKTFSVTGWRVGWVIAPPDLTNSIRKVHDFLTVGAAAPLQQASAVALGTADDYYTRLAADYAARRERLLSVLEDAGFRCFRPKGAYYVMTDISSFGFADDLTFARYLLTDVGVIGVPGSSFYADPRDGSQQMRFCFCKKAETLDAAAERFEKLARK